MMRLTEFPGKGLFSQDNLSIQALDKFDRILVGKQQGIVSFQSLNTSRKTKGFDKMWSDGGLHVVICPFARTRDDQSPPSVLDHSKSLTKLIFEKISRVDPLSLPHFP